MRTKSILLAVTTLLTLVTPGTQSASATDDVVFTGSGWGHGMGLSQWGAYERARQGQTAEEIVETYYQTASVLTLAEAEIPSWVTDDDSPVWVNMLGISSSTNRSSFQIRTSSVGLTFCQQEPKTESLWSLTNNGGEESVYVQILEQRLDDLGHDPGPIDGMFDAATDSAVRSFQTANGLVADGAVGRNTKAKLWESDSGDRCVIETAVPTSTITVNVDDDGNCPFPGALAVGDCLGSVRNLSTTTRVALPEKVDSGVPVELAHGDLRIRPDIDASSGAIEGVHVVLEVGLEDYVSGIDEVMTWWDSVGAGEALKAQAIAARTMGMRLMLSYGELGQVNGSAYPYTDTQSSFNTQRDRCWCHVYSTTLTQVYNGWTREIESGGVWPAAVASTLVEGEGTVLTAPGHGVIWAFYGSSNGGASESHNGWNGYEPPSNFSYLVSVPDPYSLNDDNPYAHWTKSFTPAAVASKLGFTEVLGVDVIALNDSGSAKTVQFKGISGGQEITVDKTGAWVDSAFGLRSRFFDVEWGDTSGGPPPPPPPPPPPGPSYEDIEGHLFEGDIEWAASQGVAFGCNPPDNDLFCPDRAVSREEMAVFMTNALDLPPTTVDYFTDDEGSPFEDAINRMAEADITRGCGGTRFCPDLKVDRGQMAAFLGRAFGLHDNGGGDLFIDDDHSIFEGDIDRLGTAGITRGCNPPANTRFCPELDVDRGAMMAFLHRALDG